MQFLHNIAAPCNMGEFGGILCHQLHCEYPAISWDVHYHVPALCAAFLLVYHVCESLKTLLFFFAYVEKFDCTILTDIHHVSAYSGCRDGPSASAQVLPLYI